MEQKCEKPTDLHGMEQALEDTNRMIYWDEISHEIDKTTLEIACCSNRCDNPTCRALQDSEEAILALEEEMADRCIIDTLPDDEFF